MKESVLVCKFNESQEDPTPQFLFVCSQIRKTIGKNIASATLFGIHKPPKDRWKKRTSSLPISQRVQDPHPPGFTDRKIDEKNLEFYLVLVSDNGTDDIIQNSIWWLGFLIFFENFQVWVWSFPILPILSSPCLTHLRKTKIALKSPLPTKKKNARRGSKWVWKSVRGTQNTLMKIMFKSWHFLGHVPSPKQGQVFV